MTPASPPVRRVQVQPPSARAELGNVVRFGMAVVLGVWMYLAANSPAFLGDAADTRRLLPFQTMIQDRPSIDQRMFRELQEGLLEAERRRVERGQWPAVPTLAGEGIPPFAPDPTAKGGAYEWQLLTSGTFVNYLGVPERPDAPAWLVLVLEPEKGAPPDPAREDEEHHKLITGEMLHVSTWMRADPRIEKRVVRIPQAEGWIQLYAVGPAPVLAPPSK